MKGSPKIINKWNVNPFAEINRIPVYIKENGVDRDINSFAMVNSENRAVLGVVSEGYELIHNQEVNQIFEDAFSDIEIVEIHDHCDIGCRKWKRRFILSPEDFAWEIGNSNDITGLMLEVFNSYTGKASYGYSLMGFRWICSNGMVMGKKPIFSSTFTHMTNALEEIRQGFTRKIEAFVENVEIWQKWNGMKFTLRDMDKYLEEKPYISDKGRSRIMDTYEEVMRIEKHDETRWGAFNTLTYMSTHKISTRKDNASPIFSNSAATLERLSNEFYELAM